jgi:hypothetical protein
VDVWIASYNNKLLFYLFNCFFFYYSSICSGGFSFLNVISGCGQGPDGGKKPTVMLPRDWPKAGSDKV